ncbi:MAG TPA: hypothetical protein VJZ91_05465 [Blastocatellia bacterium]|nr:hypothetical protein [Blastocatellia bacterium]
MPINQIDVLIKVVSVLDELAVPYVIGGSYASSARGFARATMDIDVLAALRPEHAEAFAAKLEPEFYADSHTIRRAALMRRSFNVIHMETSFKVDVFVAKPGGFDDQQLKRRQLEVVDEDQQRTAFVSTAEDIILAKLRWYRLTNETSEKQWNDVRGVVEVQGEKLDRMYLREWSQSLGVSDLLGRVFSEVDKNDQSLSPDDPA